jgi:hypothetical protein
MGQASIKTAFRTQNITPYSQTDKKSKSKAILITGLGGL